MIGYENHVMWRFFTKWILLNMNSNYSKYQYEYQMPGENPFKKVSFVTNKGIDGMIGPLIKGLGSRVGYEDLVRSSIIL